MSGMRLAGCRTDSLLGYLKVVGLIRIVSEQLDPQLRCELDGPYPEFFLNATRSELEAFLLERFRPTPVLNPWNGGAGFDEKSRQQTAGQTIARVRAEHGGRWQAYRAALDIADQVVATIDGRGIADKDDRKIAVIREYRARCSDAAMVWIDAAVPLGKSSAGFAPILGSGGNDGRLDFSINFMQRLLDVASDSQQSASVGPLLCDALDGTAAGTLLSGSAMGQFSPWATGGANATSGFDAASLVNPWDFVLMIEGAIAFAGSIVKRLDSRDDRPTFPFTFDQVAAGFGSASTEEVSRGELWLPQWRGAVSYRSLLVLLRRGRMELDTSSEERGSARRVRTAFEAVHAVMTLGAMSGLDAFERVAILQRNGLSFAAPAVGRIEVGNHTDKAMGALSRETLRWVARIPRGTSRGSKERPVGAAVHAALRHYEDAVFGYSSTRFGSSERVAALAEVLTSLAHLDQAAGMAGDIAIQPLPYLPAWLLDVGGPLDGGRPEEEWIHRVARAMCSFGVSEPRHRLRLDLMPVALKHGALNYDRSGSVLWQPDLKETLALVLERRVRALDQPSGATALAAGTGIDARDFAPLFEASHTLLERLRDRVLAYSIVEPWVGVSRSDGHRPSGIPISFSAIKIVIDRVRSNPAAPQPPVDPEIPTLLRYGATPRALAIAYRRLRSSGFAPIDFRHAVHDGRTLAAWSLIPTNSSAQRAFHNAVSPGDPFRDSVSPAGESTGQGVLAS